MNHIDEIEGITSKAPVECRLATCRVDELHPHASYLWHHLTVPASKLSALAERGDLAFPERLAITNTRTILDGYARWILAGLQERPTLPCLEYGLSEAEALQWILRTISAPVDSMPSTGSSWHSIWNRHSKKKARLNQRAGGRFKGSSNLTEADKLDVRSEIAAAAGASVGNVSKVKQLLMAAHSELLEALRNGEISIHRAWLWNQETPEEQRDALWRHWTENGIKKTIRHLVSRHRSKIIFAQPNCDHVAARLAAMLPSQKNSVKVGVIKNAGKAIYLTEELALDLDIRQMRLCESSNR
jgi:hypothetical protein